MAMKPTFHVAALALALAAGAAPAQDLTFYEYRDFGGRAFSARDAVPDLANTGYNDRASSVVVRSGIWQVCTDANFRGRCVTLQPGEYRDLDPMGIASNISSARPVGRDTLAAGPGPGPDARGPAVVLFDDFQQAGRQFAVDGAVDNLDRTGFNDRARSMIIHAGRWELCADAYFHGTCEVYGPGVYSAIGDLSGELSSLRPVGGPLATPGRYPPDWGRQVRAILYSNPDFQGQQYVVGGDVLRDLANTGFNDRAQSIRVEQGFWIFCSDADFGGTCRTFGPGDYPNLPWGLDNAVSSGRRISTEYPYGGPPSWGR
ncbi:MAG TPA: beta/gamma crystallin-related protein [Casimicrobiaceae bacterium]|nr:beta/gamma crystallin-related protein [Casimicrobiaceae bacterium]